VHRVYRWINVYVCGCVRVCLSFLLFICIKRKCVLKRIHKVQNKNCLDMGYVWIFVFCVEGLVFFFWG